MRVYKRSNSTQAQQNHMPFDATRRTKPFELSHASIGKRVTPMQLKSQVASKPRLFPTSLEREASRTSYHKSHCIRVAQANSTCPPVQQNLPGFSYALRKSNWIVGRVQSPSTAAGDSLTPPLLFRHTPAEGSAAGDE